MDNDDYEVVSNLHRKQPHNTALTAADNNNGEASLIAERVIPIEIVAASSPKATINHAHHHQQDNNANNTGFLF